MKAAMPGRKKTQFAKLFKDVPSDGKVANVKCLFFSTVLSKTGSRMVKYTEKCKKCDETVKERYLMKDKGQKTVPSSPSDTETEEISLERSTQDITI